MSFQDLPSDTRELKEISRYRLGKLEGQKKTIFKKMTVETEKSKFFKKFFLHNTQNYFLHRSPSTVFCLLKKKFFRFFHIQEGAKVRAEVSTSISPQSNGRSDDPIYVFCGIFNEEFDGDISFFSSVQNHGQKISFTDLPLLKHVNFTNTIVYLNEK